ncbi:MAG: carbon-nitrogen family hydrolase [Synergistales bacterium]|nr:carbon-nitrogen family hydrolase [Synergistales bacterium]
MKISLIQMDVKRGLPDRNYEQAAILVREAANSDPDVILLPEMWNTGYELGMIKDLADPEGQRTEALMSDLSSQLGVNIVAGSVACLKGNDVFNTLMAFDRKGKKIAEYSKIHLFRLMQEDKYLRPGTVPCTFDLEDIRFGVIICYDLRFPELSRLLALGGAQVLLVPAQWPYPRLNHWKTLLDARAIENQFFVAGCNRVGQDPDKTIFFGYSKVVDPWGNVLGEILDERESILTVEMDLQEIEKVRNTLPVFQDRKPSTYRGQQDPSGQVY